MFKFSQICLKFFETLTIKLRQSLNAHGWLLLLGVKRVENKCIRDNEVLSAVENFEIMLTQLIKILEKIKKKKLKV